MHTALVNRSGGLTLSRQSVVRLIDRLDMALDVNRGRKTTKKKTTIIREDVVVEEVVCVALWKGAGVTFGNFALFKDRYIVL